VLQRRKVVPQLIKVFKRGDGLIGWVFDWIEAVRWRCRTSPPVSQFFNAAMIGPIDGDCVIAERNLVACRIGDAV
jgi:hypothetical protein